MSKRHRPGHLTARQLDAELAEIDTLIETRKWMQARDRLEALERGYPDHREILAELLNVDYELRDMQAYLPVCERLVQLAPNDADLVLALAGAYMMNARPASAAQTFRRFISRFPGHERAAEVRKTLVDLNASLEHELSTLGLFGEQGREIAVLHERTLTLLDQGKYRQAREAAEELLRRHPNFLPALNNIAQSYMAEGNVAQATATAERVLSMQPDNFHALANMVQYQFVQGQFDQAQMFADRLQSVQSDAVDIWLRKAEAASYLGDDQAVLDAFHGAERAGHLKPPLGSPLLFHLAAVAAVRLGNPAQARHYWSRALEIAPGMDIARENVHDLGKPVGERHAPWAFTEANWISQRTIQDLIAAAKHQTKSSDRVVAQAMSRFLEHHPEIPALVPVLFDRGDPKARELALQIARIAQTPELVTSLRDFALSQRGPDQMRHEAARVASKAGLIPKGPVRMWMNGQWQDVLLLDYELNDEPTFRHTRPVEQWLAQSVGATQEGNLDRAEHLIHRALEVESDAPDVLNNLATLHELRGRKQEAETLLRQLIEKHPDYSFPRINMARLCMARGDLQQAETMLRPLLTRTRFNISEFGFFCNAQIELLMAKRQTDGARQWLEMWSSIDPENPLIGDWQRRLTGRTPWRRLWERA